MCVSGVRSRVVSCERERVSCEWASRRSSVVRREAFCFSIVRLWDSEVFVSNFEFEFLVSLLYSISRISIFVSNLNLSSNSISRISIRICRRNFRFEFRVQVPWIFDSSFEFKSLEFSCRTCRRIRLLEFRIRISNSNLSSKFLVEIFDVLLYSISRISLWIRRRIRLLEFRCSIRLLEIDRQIRLLEFRVLESSPLNFEFVLLYSTSRISICDFDSKLWWSSSSRIAVLEVAFFIWVLNWTIQFSSKLLISNWRRSLFSHDRSRFALVATRALRALFVRKILVKRQFTFSLYFGIIEL